MIWNLEFFWNLEFVIWNFYTERSEVWTFDLHALDTPPAFILSQDQTLKKEN